MINWERYGMSHDKAMPHKVSDTLWVYIWRGPQAPLRTNGSGSSASEGAAKLLPSMLSTPMRKEQGVETINDGETTVTKPPITDTEKPIGNGDIISDFKAYAEKTVGAGTQGTTSDTWKETWAVL